VPVLREKVDDINYKDVKMLHAFVAERGKIVPRRISGVCAAPAPAHGCNQEGAEHRAAAVRGSLLGGGIHGSHTERRREKLAAAAKW
jgi:hypothetical protein